MYFDSHCHLTDERFAADLDDVLGRARAAGVDRIVTVASDAEDAGAAARLSRRYPGVYATAGIHPHAASAADDAARGRVAELAESGEVVAIGETGLDYHYDFSDRPSQRALFRWHLELAAARGLPVVVHCREADDDVAAAIRDARGVTGVLHCFAGGAALLEAGLEAGWYVSFSGLVTFRNFQGEALVRAVPAERLLIETDGPYLAPVPHRGKRNEPAYVVHVAAALARIRGESAEDVARATARNAAALYGLGPG